MASEASLLFTLIGKDMLTPVLKRAGVELDAVNKQTKESSKAAGLNLGGLAVAGVAVGAVKAAGDFQQATNLYVTAAGESTKNLAVVRSGIESIATGTGTSISQLTEGMYTLEKAGIRGADGVNVLKAAAQGAREEGADLGTVVGAMTTIMSNYGAAAGTPVQVMNQLKTAAGESKTTMEAFSASLSSVLPIAAKNKISFAEVAGAIATMTQNGVSADQATQNVNNTITNLAAPTQVAVNAMAQVGINSQQVSQNLGKNGVAGTVQMLSETVLSKMGPAGKVLLNTFYQSQNAAADLNRMLGAMDPATRKAAQAFQAGSITSKQWRADLKGMTVDQANMAREFATTDNKARGFNDAIKSGQPGAQTYTQLMDKMLGGTTGLNTALMLTGDNAAPTAARIATIAQAAKDTGKNVEGWDSTQKLFNVRLDQFKESVQVAGINIGNDLLPVLSSVFGLVSDHTTLFAALAGVVVGGAVAFYTFKAAVAAWNIVMAVARGAAAAWAVTQNLLNITLFGCPLLLIIGLVAALAFGIYELVKHFDAVKSGVKTAFDAVKNAVMVAFNWVKGHWPLLLAILTGPIGLAVYAIVKYWSNLKSAAAAVWHAISSAFSSMWSAVKSGIDKAIQWFKDLPGNIVKGLGDIGSTLLQMGKDLIQGFINGITSMAGNIASTIKDKVVGVAKSALHGFGLFGSPSKLTLQYGKWWTEGFVIGMKETSAQVVQQAKDLLDTLKQKLTDARNYQQQIRDSFVQGADITQLDAVGSPGLLQALTVQADQATKFASTIDTLRKAGLNSDTLEQLKSAGVGSLATATSLLTGGQIAAINAQEARISGAGSTLGRTEAKAIYGIDPDAANKVLLQMGKQKVTVGFDFTNAGDDAFVAMLRKAVRVRGGNVQVVLGK